MIILFINILIKIRQSRERDEAEYVKSKRTEPSEFGEAKITVYKLRIKSRLV